MTPYQNPFNWLLFICIGILYRENEEMLQRLINKALVKVIIVMIFLALFLAQVFLVEEISYWNISSIPLELTGILTGMYVSKLMANINILVDMGQKTLFIFLIHLQIVGVINTRLPQTSFFYFIKPIIGVMVVYALAKIFIWFSRLVKMDKILWIVGLKNR